jgi:cytochrome c oxidase subunit II
MNRTSVAIVIALVSLFAIAGGWRRHASAKVRAGGEQVIHITAKKFEYTPNEITLKKGVPVTIEITSLDRDHGFKVPELGLRADVKPGETTRVRIVPDRVGRFEFRCDVFCGSGHEDMAGEFVVVD